MTIIPWTIFLLTLVCAIRAQDFIGDQRGKVYSQVPTESTLQRLFRAGHSIYSRLSNYFIRRDSEAIPQDLSSAFESFVQLYDKDYSPEEVQKRQRTFQDHKREIDSWNELYRQGKVTYAMETNQLADLTDDELDQFKSLRAPENLTMTRDSSSLLSSSMLLARNDHSLPSSWSWVDFFGPVRSQEQCGSCYAFATLETLMASKAIFENSRPLRDYSVQQIVDCGNNNDRSGGCAGGWPANTINYLKRVRLIADERSYPYTGREGQCKLNGPQRAAMSLYSIASLNGSPSYLELRSEDEFLYHVANTGPIIAAMHASSKFNFYSRGIFDDSSCFGRQWNHAVIVVGYGTEGGVDYWLIRNSFGTRWGRQGYMRMLRGKHLCKIGTMGWVITQS